MRLVLDHRTYPIDVDARDCSSGCACIGVYTWQGMAPHCPRCAAPLVTAKGRAPIDARGPDHYLVYCPECDWETGAHIT